MFDNSLDIKVIFWKLCQLESVLEVSCGLDARFAPFVPLRLPYWEKGREERGVTGELHAGKTRVAEDPSGSGKDWRLLSPLNSPLN